MEAKEGRDFFPYPQLHLLGLLEGTDFMLAPLADTLPLHNFHESLGLEPQKVRAGGKLWDHLGTPPSFS